MTLFIPFDTGANLTSPSRRTFSFLLSSVSPFFFVTVQPLRLVFGAQAASISRNDLAPVSPV